VQKALNHKLIDKKAKACIIMGIVATKQTIPTKTKQEHANANKERISF
jgi:hypothetical protein